MNSQVTTLDDERQRLVQELVVDNGSNWAEQYKPGSFGCHELLDRAALLVGVVEQNLLTHPACVQNPEWYALAERAVAALNELYQRVGAEHGVDKVPVSCHIADSAPHREQRVISLD